MGEKQILGTCDFGQDSLLTDQSDCSEFLKLEIKGLAQLKASLIMLLKNDWELRKTITDMVAHNPYLVREDDGGFCDTDFL